MSEISNKERTYSEYEIRRSSWKPETRKMDVFMRDLPVLQRRVQGLKRNGILDAHALETIFYLTAVKAEILKEVFYELDIDLVDWEQLATVYRGA